MWSQYEEYGANFDAGEEQADMDVEYERLRKQADVFGMMNAEAMARKLGFGGGDVGDDILGEEEEEDFLSEIMRNAALEDPEQADIQSDGQTIRTESSSEWFPYPTKTMFLLDTLDNLPRLRVSNSLMRVFLWILKEARCKDVPSFDHLRRIQKQIRSDCGIPSIPCKSPLGNVFFMNDPRAIIAQDWTNPTTRKLIHVYPEIPEDGIIREIWHAQKWRKNMKLDALSPMYYAGSSHYYVNEIARLNNGDFVIPIRWVKFRGKVYADAFSVKFDDQKEVTVIDRKTVFISVSDLRNNYLDLQDQGKVPKWSAQTAAAGHHERMPNPKRAIAKGRPLYHSFVDYFGDNVSGNRSKLWNKHWNAYMTHRNLPRKLLQQEFHVHFVSTSPNASISEQYREFKSTVESTHTEPVEVQDDSGDSTCFCIYVNGGPSDNPMQSEVSGHIGGKGNRFCRKCEAGGTQKEKSTDEGTPRTKEKIMAELEKQVKLACAGVMQPIKDSQTLTGIKDIAFLTTDGFDPTKDTPVEILHTILLGVVKYIWHAGSLIGRQFKTIAQTNVFHVYDLITDHQFMAWKATGELAALLWVPEIRNLAEYRRDLKVAVANVLDVFSLIDPSKIITKIKLHLLAHIDSDAVEIGPLVGVATEIFESFNAIFRYCSILSNHLAPSRDIAIQLGDQKGLKHRLTAGRWFCHAAGEWQSAGPGVRHFISQHPVLQRLLGLAEQKLLKHGEVKFEPLKRGQKNRPNYALKSTTAATAVNYGMYEPESKWSRCSSVVGESLDECFVGSWIFAQSVTDANCTISGRISEILANSSANPVVVLEAFQVLSVRDDIYGMPVLVRRDGEKLFNIIPAKNIKFKINVQHDCYTAKCEATGERLRMQERVESDQTENFIVHKPLDRFIINSHAFHNAHLLRATLPRDLIAPIPLFEQRREKHAEFAATFRANRASKAAKRKAGAAKKPKASRKPSGSGKRQRKGSAENLQAEPFPENGGLVGGRAKRFITRTERAKAADEVEDSEDDEESSSDSDSDMYHTSDSD
ncbi:hypothetical protein DFH07DRAFT_866840 [Mycena maculata]|uniref:Uncharacterized protein n=1 Tax=Mycena maculata TaxID=230809 RepID=A0AAD7JQ84_9AGAR|nr:hypothetical protein DFH07DRAFT_866840 [Mycena maculata]